jgi:hypothetical protein
MIDVVKLSARRGPRGLLRRTRSGETEDPEGAPGCRAQPREPVGIVKHTVIRGPPQPPGPAAESGGRERFAGEPHYRHRVGVLAQLRGECSAGSA